MKFLLRTLLAILMAMWIAVPTVGGEGGENGGGTGVWILPACSFVMPSVGAVGEATGPVYQMANLTQDVTLVVAEECGQVMATMCEPSSAVLVPLTVSGRNVTVPASTVRAFSDANVSSLQIVIVDAAQCGYQMTLTINRTAQTASLQIH